jgi:hypothetical protein
MNDQPKTPYYVGIQINHLPRLQYFSTLQTTYHKNDYVIVETGKGFELGLIKRLYFNQLYFQKRSQDIVKKMILKEDNASYKLSYISTTSSNADHQSWVLGYIEENKHVYFFVLSTKSINAEDFPNKNIEVLKQILLQQGFLKGRR